MAAKIIDYIDKDDKYHYWNYDNRYYDTDKVSILLASSGIEHEGKFNFQTLKRLDEETLNRLYNKIFKNNLSNFFYAPNAIKVLEIQENFSNINFYLDECLRCINADAKIAGAILLRSCVEIFINIFDNTSNPLAKKIDNFFKNIDNHKDLKAFCEHGKKDELKEFLESVKNL